MGKNKLPVKVADKDLYYVQQAIKRCRYKVDIDNLLIYVPIDEEPDMMALHLSSKNERFGFVIQYTIDDVEINDSAFNPVMGLGRKQDKPVIKVPEPTYRRGEEFKTRDGVDLRIFDSTKNGKTTNLTMQVIGSMEPNFKINLFSAKINVEKKIWILKNE